MIPLPWRHSLVFAGLLLLAGAVVAPASPSALPDELKKAQQLVRQLGSEVYQEREQAIQLLQQMGLPAKLALQQGLIDPDLEIRRRCEELLPDILELDLRNRISAFLADKEGKSDHDLPHWSRYREVAGSDAGSRQLFCEMLQGDTLTFLLNCASNPDRQSDTLERYVRLMQTRAFQPAPGRVAGQYTRGDIAAVLFIGSEVKIQNQQSPNLISSMFYQQTARTALADPAVGSAFKKLTLRWMSSQTNENVILQLCNVIQNLNLKEGADFLTTVIKEKKVRGISLAQAAINLARTGNKDHVALLETLLKDETVLAQMIQLNQIRGTTEVRDVALAMLVHLTGQSHKEYGFSFLSQYPNLMWSPHYLGFSTPQQRENAHEKWQEWVSKNQKK